MRAHMKRMEDMLSLDSNEVRMIGIWGPPGIGKSTIARVLYNQFSSSYQLRAIMVNIKASYPTPCLDENSAQLQLQSQMLSQIINQKDIIISHLGVAQERLKDKKVFLVLDDVNHVRQLHALAKETQWFGPGSRIIITTEDERVLKAHRIKHVYKVDFPSSDEAFQIFCMHAFGEIKHPDDDFYDLAWEVMALAGKLPLGLKVLGSALRGLSKQEWERRLPRLKTCLDGEIESVIKFSYDALRDEEQYLFLYIACLYSFKIPRKVEELLEKHIVGVGQSLDILAEKSLISIDLYGSIEMHSLLVQFGIKTSREQFIVHGRAKRQLLVGERDICEVLNDDTTDSRRFIGINLDLSKIEEELNVSEKAIERMSDLQFISIYGYGRDGVAHSERLHSLLYYSQKIRSLHWEHFQNICLPSTFNPEFLVELVMKFSKLHKLWEGTKPLRNLKWMDWSHSRDLKELPDLSTATNLEELILRECSSLVELPSSIGKLTSLEILDLKWCSSLVKLPSFIGNAINLWKVFLQGCSSLGELPSSIFNIKYLEELDLRYCSSLVELPFSLGNATNLQKLELSNCSSLVKLPSSIENATNLTKLDLSDCLSLVELPSSIFNIKYLEELDLSYCSSLVELPFSLGNATNLQKLDLHHCSSLVKLPSSIENATNLTKLDLSDCSSLVELPISLGNATNLQKLKLRTCSSLVQLPSIENATNLTKLDLFDCSSLVELPSIGNATKLEKLNLGYCSSLVKLPSSINATNLQKLSLTNCSRVVELPAIENATNLHKLLLKNCSNLPELPPSIGSATNLQILDISGCSSLVKLPTSIGDFTNIQKFMLNNCSSLVELPPSIGTATNLLELDISGCSSLMKLPTSIGDITDLIEFNLSYCSSLVELPSSIGKLQHLKEMRMCGCSKLEALPTNINLESLDQLDLTNCSQLKSFPEISTNIKYLSLIGTAIKEVPLSIMLWSRLSEFEMSYFESLKDFSHALGIITMLQFDEDIQEVGQWVKGMSRLRQIRLNDCNNLVSLPLFADSLSYINADNCKSLERLDCSFNNPEIRLKFTNCFKLNQEARELIMHTSTSGYAILPGTQVPASFNYRATGGGPLTIKLNEWRHLFTSLKFKACIVLDTKETDDDEPSMSGVYMDIMDKQNHLKVLFEPSYHIINQLLTEHIYTFNVEAEEVTSTELVFKFYIDSSKWKIGGCGLLQILEIPSC